MGACAKHVFLVTDPAQLEATLRTAFTLARSGRPGPVVVDVPKDVQNTALSFRGTGELALTGYRARLRASDQQGGWVAIKVQRPGIRPIVEIESADAIFHTVYDLDQRYQVPGEWSIHTGVHYRNDGYTAHWRGIYDDRGRLMVAIAFNSDLGDSWEWADDSDYPEEYSALGIRIGANYIVYSMTH